MESLVEELIQTKILQQVPELSISNFKGEYCLSSAVSKDPLNKAQILPPNIGELQRVININIR